MLEEIMKNSRSFRWASVCVLALVIGCSDDEEEVEPEPAVCDPKVANPGCHGDRVCELVSGGEPRCHDPYSIVGKVFDSVTDEPISGARVVARDVNGAAVSGVAISGVDGSYRLPVPVERNAEGTPTATKLEVLLRADAQGYATFPKPPRTALPLDVMKANAETRVLQTAATEIALVALQDATGVGTISGSVRADAPGGTLLVAGGATAVADLRGSFTIFNVPAGTTTVSGYLTGVNLESKSVDVVANETVGDVVLESVGEASANVSGTVTFVNPGSGITSVILVVADTFQENVARGESPPGLKTGLDVVGPFEIRNVPDGRYKVLAGFENDGFVRDPSSIGGTSIVEVTVAGANVALPASFKVTGALAVRSPDNEDEVTGTPTFVWEDDSGEASYDVVLYDALGTEVWKKNRPSVSGSTDVSQAYDGDLSLLKSGMIYQFKALSLNNAGVPLSSTEDLKGVFVYE
jgi:hypothetical protein